MIHLNQICKRFKNHPQDQWILNNINLDIQTGERVAFLGPNGAGKSTVIKLLTGILHPTSGQVKVAGLNPVTQRKALSQKIGSVFGNQPKSMPEFSVLQNLEMFRYIYGIQLNEYNDRLKHLSRYFDVESLFNQSFGSLSLGQKMRVELVVSLLHRPEVLILDEPSIGLDLLAKSQLRDCIRWLADHEGITLLLTSHDTQDIEGICQRVVMIHSGRILQDEAMVDIQNQLHQRKTLRFITHEKNPIIDCEGLEFSSPKHYCVECEFDTQEFSVQHVVQAALAQIEIVDMSIESAPLESYIQHLLQTGHQDHCDQVSASMREPLVS